jgi:hypothetical protein
MEAYKYCVNVEQDHAYCGFVVECLSERVIF